MKKVHIIDIIIICLAIICFISVMYATRAFGEEIDSLEETSTVKVSSVIQDNEDTVSNNSTTTTTQDANQYECNFEIEANSLLGDVDASGAVDASDAAIILTFVAERILDESYIPSEAELAVADTYEDGVIDSLDAAAIRLYSAHLGTGKTPPTWEEVKTEIDENVNEEND